jgi:hypothetical protein
VQIAQIVLARKGSPNLWSVEYRCGVRVLVAVAVVSTTLVAGTGRPTVPLAAARSVTWSQRAQLTPLLGVPGEYFGYAEAISGNIAMVGMPFKNNRGAVDVFVRAGAPLPQRGQVMPSNQRPA